MIHYIICITYAYFKYYIKFTYTLIQPNLIEKVIDFNSQKIKIFSRYIREYFLRL